VKATCDKADPRGVKLGSDNVVVPEELSAEDLALLTEKERNKILNQRATDTKKAERESMRAIAKAVREATTAKDKEAKKGEKPGKSKVITPQPLLTETSTASPLQNPHKRDSSLAQLSVSRLQ
jgi:topoisomerase IA-like protein